MGLCCDFVCEMFLFHHSVSVAVGLSHFLILLLIDYLAFLSSLFSFLLSISNFLCFIYCLSLPHCSLLLRLPVYLHPPSPSLSPPSLLILLCLHVCLYLPA